MRSLLTTLLAAVLVCAAAPRPASAETAGMRQLLDNVQYWQKQNRPDKAAEAWKKILQADPSNQKALIELAAWEAGAGRKSEAEKYLQRLEKLSPGHPEIVRIRRMMDLGGKYDTILGEARNLVKQKKMAEAIAKYREAFGKQQPGGRLGIEFYSTLGGQPDGWDEAREGLARMAAVPGDLDAQLAYAKHLTYREPTRREGIERLRALAKTRVGAEARAAWKAALLWMQQRPGDLELLRQYLAEAGEDAAIRGRQKELAAAAYVNPIQVAGDKAMKEGDLARAEGIYREAMGKTGRDRIEGMLGMARLAMHKKEHVKARDQLLQVKAEFPRMAALWLRFLQVAEFWVLLERAETEIAAGKLAEADATLNAAQKLSRQDKHHCDPIRARVLIAQGKAEAARTLLEGHLRKYPEDAGAMKVLAQLLATQGKLDEAAEWAARAAKIDGATPTLDKSRLQSEKLRAQAAAARTQGDFDAAAALLTEAYREDPKNEWVVHDLALVHLTLGNADEARIALERLQVLKPDLAEAKVIEARLLAEEGRLGEALVALGPVGKGSPAEVIRLERMLRIRQAAARLVARHRGGTAGIAAKPLEDLQRDCGDDAQLLGTVALAWSEIGDTNRALKTMRRVLALSPGNVSSRLQYAAVLLHGQRYHDLSLALEDLEHERMNAYERRDFSNLQIALAIRRADSAREEGDSRRAFEHLRPMLEAYPEDKRVLSALGRLFLDTADHASAYAIFQRLLRLHPNDLEAREGAIRSAMVLKKEPEAARLVREGLELEAENPRMVLVAARHAVLVGDDARAVDLLKQAEVLAARASEGEGDRSALKPDSEPQDIIRVAFRRFETRPDDPSERPVRPLAEVIRGEMDEIQGRYSEDIATAPTVRHRVGQAGLGQLTEIRIPVAASFPTGYYGRLTLMVTPEILLGGSLDLGNEQTAARFGQVGIWQYVLPDKGLNQTRYGAGIDVGWEYRGLDLYLGTTPLGFPLQTFVGGIGYHGNWSGFGLGIQAGRREVNDSMLSLSGAVDPAYGQKWGLVTANGGRLDLSYGPGRVVGYVFGGFDYLMGANVLSNMKGYGGLGLRWRLYDTGPLSVATGFALGAMGFQHNLRHFTWGHGGYFSPQRFVNVGVPLEIRGKYPRFRFEIVGDLGLNWFKEDAADYYPRDEALQKARLNRKGTDNLPVEAVYPSKTSLGFAANALARVGYVFKTQLLLGAEFQMHFAADYQEYVGLIAFGYGFRTNGAPQMPVARNLHAW